MRKNFRSDKASVTNAPGVPVAFQDRLQTDVGANLLGTESGRDFTKLKAVWDHEGATTFVHVKTHIDPKNLKVHDDVGDYQNKEGKYTSTEQIFRIANILMALMWFVQLCSLMWKGSTPEKSDFSLGVIVASAFTISRFAFVWLSRPLMHKFAAGFDNSRRVQEMADSLFQAMYFTVMLIIGFLILKDESYFPSIMGGKGDLWGTDIEKFGLPDELITYYVVQIGYYAHCIFFLLVDKRKHETLEMILYAQVAIFLAVFALSQGYERFGVVLLLLHDVGNAPAFLLKVMKDGEMFLPTLILYTALMPLWMYTRIYILCTMFYPRIMETVNARGENKTMLYIPVALLVVNHVYVYCKHGFYGILLLMGEG